MTNRTHIVTAGFGLVTLPDIPGPYYYVEVLAGPVTREEADKIAGERNGTSVEWPDAKFRHSGGKAYLRICTLNYIDATEYE